MLRRRAKPSGGGGTEQQHKIAFDHGRAAAVSPPFASPPAMLLVASSGEVSPKRAEAVMMSPTSILQTAAASPTSPGAACGRGGTAAPFSRRGDGGGGSGDRRYKSHRPWDAKPVGLGLVGALNGDGAHDLVACASSTVLTGQKLRVQTNHAPCPCSPPKEFGVTSGGAAGGAPAPSLLADRNRVRHAHAPSRHRRCLSPTPREMEMSEDYTRVIAREPNPRTTHIFGDRVVESRRGFGFSPEREASGFGGGNGGFLSHCHGCGKDLGQGKDIFMYRGERAFCSCECRYREMLFDEGTVTEEL